MEQGAGTNSRSLAGLAHPISLVGLMGAGKSRVGRGVANRLNIPFIDADREIEEAAGCEIPEIFDRFGEDEFRRGERRVIDRLIRENPVHILATGGGAFIDDQTRSLLLARSVVVWLRAELDVLVRRTGKRDNRPLLRDGDPREVLAELMEARHPIYAQAHVTVDSGEGPPEATIDKVVDSVRTYLESGEADGAGGSGDATSGERPSQ